MAPGATLVFKSGITLKLHTPSESNKYESTFPSPVGTFGSSDIS